MDPELINAHVVDQGHSFEITVDRGPRRERVKMNIRNFEVMIEDYIKHRIVRCVQQEKPKWEQILDDFKRSQQEKEIPF
jgi:hypothetical protein